MTAPKLHTTNNILMTFCSDSRSARFTKPVCILTSLFEYLIMVLISLRFWSQNNNWFLCLRLIKCEMSILNIFINNWLNWNEMSKFFLRVFGNFQMNLKHCFSMETYFCHDLSILFSKEYCTPPKHYFCHPCRCRHRYRRRRRLISQ